MTAKLLEQCSVNESCKRASNVFDEVVLYPGVQLYGLPPLFVNILKGGFDIYVQSPPQKVIKSY